ncbi:MAG: tetratricopeptide repeat protein [Candidatus Omnitrophota bacterium]|nr:MAG: tetratricopeptide repeat protein [Candidatus Omnitrophota bacterium]
MSKIRNIFIGIFLSIFVLQTGFALSNEEEKFYIAKKAFDDGFYGASLSLLQRFIKDFPESPRAYEVRLYIAKCYYFNKNYPPSLQTLHELTQKKEAIQILDEVYYWLAQVYFIGKDYQGSLSYLAKIIEDYPDSQFWWWAHYLTANCHFELGKDIEAQETLKKIVEKSKQKQIVESAYELLLGFYSRYKDHSQIIKWGQRYLKEFSKGNLRAQVYHYLGESLVAQNKFDEAIRYYQRALTLNEGFQVLDLIHQGLSTAYIEKNDLETAQTHIARIKNDELRTFVRGMFYFKIKNYTQALKVFVDFLEEFKESKFLPLVYLHKADTLYEMGRVNDSLLVYHDILEKFNLSQHQDILDKAYYGLAWCYLKNSEFKKAIEEFKHTLKYTDNPMVQISSQIQIADAYQEAEKYERALDTYNEVLKNNPNTVYVDYIQFQIGIVFLKMNRLPQALLALKNLKRNYPSSRLVPQAQYYLAVGYFSVGQYAEAKSLLEDFIAKFSNSDLIDDVRYLYAKCFFNEGDYEKALEIFEQLRARVRKREIEELVYIDIGNTYLNLSRFEKAKRIWQSFLARFARSQYAGSVALYLGGLYEKEDDLDGAERYYKRVIRQYKDSLWENEALLSLGHLYWQKGNLKKAEDTFKKLAAKGVNLAFNAKLYLAKLYTEKNDLEAAAVLYDELIESNSSFSKAAILDKAYLLKEMKKYSEAITCFERATKEGLDSPKLRFFLALCLEKTNQSKKAIDEYFKVIYTFKDDDYMVKSYFRIARIHERDGNFGAAKEIYEKIMDFEVEEAKIARARLKALQNQ